MPTVVSPNVESTEPQAAPDRHPPSLSRRSSKPSSLRIHQADWTPDLELAQSPLQSLANGKGNLPPQNVRDSAAPDPAAPDHYTAPPMKSPCFVHSHLDKGASLADWLRSKQYQMDGGPNEVGVAKSLQRHNDGQGRALENAAILEPFGGRHAEDDDDYAGSLTKQLAETAVGVREMSKQLG
jgi:NAD+ kinase